MQTFRQGNNPGFTSQVYSEEVELRAAVNSDHNPITEEMVQIAADTVDAGNVPTTTLRGGNVLARDTAGVDHLYDPTANDGTQCPAAILPHFQDMIRMGVPTAAFTKAITRGYVRARDLVNFDRHAHAVFERIGIKVVPDDGSMVPDGSAFLVAPKCVQRHAANYTVTAADHGKLMIATAAVNFTLPTIAHGLTFEFLQTAGNNLIVTGDSNIIADNNATASTLTFSTASQLIGSRVRVRAIYISDTTLRWVVEKLTGNTMTVA